MTGRRANQLIAGAGVLVSLGQNGNNVPKPSSEAVARPLAALPEPERQQVWKDTVERVGDKPKATDVQETIAHAEPPPPTMTDLMVEPETIAPYLAATPPPADADRRQTGVLPTYAGVHLALERSAATFATAYDTTDRLEAMTPRERREILHDLTALGLAVEKLKQLI